jgi:hypothetical protein
MRTARAETVELLQQTALQIAREKLGSVTAEQEQAIRGMNDPRVVAKVIAGIASVSERGELDALLARVAGLG